MKKTLCVVLTISAIMFTGCTSPNKSAEVTETAITTRTAQVTASPEASESASSSAAETKKEKKGRKKTSRTLVESGSTVVVTADEDEPADSDRKEPTARRSAQREHAARPENGAPVAPVITDDDFSQPSNSENEARADKEKTSNGVTCYAENGYVFISRNNGKNGFSAQVTEGDSPELESLGATTDGGSLAYDASVGNGDVKVIKDGSTYRFVGNAYLDSDNDGDSSFDFSATCPQ